VKGPRYLTHMLRLKNIAAPLANFFASVIFRLGRKLGPILWQLAPNFPFHAARIEAFFKLLPCCDTKKAAPLVEAPLPSRLSGWLLRRSPATCAACATRNSHPATTFPLCLLVQVRSELVV
jgi:uncharacterized protein YecE (DUF72 family)